jgi:hydrogenase expression/formation protein HypD
MIYSPADALALAQQHPERQVVFFAIGFETTTPPTAVLIKQAQALGLRNFSVLCCHVLTPSAIASILESPEVRRWGSCRSTASSGRRTCRRSSAHAPYEFFAEEYRKPVVIAGFEPLDVMQAILMLIKQVNAGQALVENEFSRAVSRDGNRKAQQLVSEVFELRRSFAWRGLGELPYSALRIRQEFADFDAERRFAWLSGGRRPSGLRVRRRSARRQAAAGLPHLRQRVYPGKPGRLVHGVIRRRLRRALFLWPLC